MTLKTASHLRSRVAELGPPSRGTLQRYGVAIACTAVALGASAALLPLSSTAIWAPLLGAVTISVWYGGIGPAILSLALGWVVGSFALAEPHFSFSIGGGGERVRASTFFAVAIVIIWAAWAMRRGQTRAAAAAGEAESTLDSVERLQELASQLSASATRADVAHALVDGTSELLGARGGSVGLIDGDTLEIVDPLRPARQMLAPGLRMPLETRAPITTAARTGSIVCVENRPDFEEQFPDGARLAPYAAGALAVPIRVGERVIGSMGFPFVAPQSIGEEGRALAQIAADLGGQALERAGLYESERESRAALERMLRVAPRFADAGSTLDVAAAVGREARRAFGADFALVLSFHDSETFEVLCRDPESANLPPGARLSFAEFPGFRTTGSGQPMFVPDVRLAPPEDVLRLLLESDVVSAMRAPIVIGDRAVWSLILQWRMRVSDPDASLVGLVRRFADQAGLALEQAERRQAEAEAGRRAEETQRLLEVSAALAGAARPEDVADVVLERGRVSLGASAGSVMLLEGDRLELLASTGYGDELVEAFRGIPLSDAVPPADAARHGEAVVLRSEADRRSRYPALAGHGLTGASITLPLTVAGQPLGCVSFGFAGDRDFAGADLDFAGALARQAAQALERARLLEAEQAARERAERTAGNLAQLHSLGTALARAHSPAEVAEAVGLQLIGVLGAQSAGVMVVDDAGTSLELIGRSGSLSPDLAVPEEAIPLDAPVPAADVVRERRSVWLLEPADWEPYGGPPGDEGVVSMAVVPMIATDRAIGVVFVTFDRAARLDEGQRRLVETVGRQAAEPLARVSLLEAERQARRDAELASGRTQRLQAVTEALAAAATPVDLADAVVREAAAALTADSVVLLVPAEGGDRLEPLGAVGCDGGELAAWLERAGEPATHAILSGAGPGVIESADAPAQPALAGLAAATDASAGICVPVTIGLRTLGALWIAFRTPRSFDQAERSLAATIARQCAVALERARLFDREHASGARVRRLQAVTAALSQAATPREVAVTCLDQAAAAVGAHGGVVALLSADGDELELVGSLGYADDELADWRRIPVDAPVPVAEAVRSCSPVWALSDEQVRRYDLLRPIADSAGDRAWAALPLMAGSAARGALLLSFGEPVQLSAEDRDWLVALAGQCAQALDRSRLYDDERRSRRRAERLQAMTAALTNALTQDEVAAVMLDQSVAAFEVDIGQIALYRPDRNELESVRYVGADATALAPWLRYPVGAAYPSAAAFREQRSLQLDREGYVAAYPHLAAAFVPLGIESIAYVPLVAGGRSLGVAVFAWCTPRVLDESEVTFFETLASQCALALDRARRYESERTIAETLQRSVLPESLPSVDGIELAARYLPGTAGVDVGGDWFDVIPLEGGRVGLVVGDVVGKGVKAAATMGQMRNGLRAFALDERRPAPAVSRLNKLLDSVSDAPFATLAYVSVDPRSGVCRYTVAGHPPPLLVSPDRDGGAEFLTGGRSLPLGVGNDVEYGQDVVELEPGALIVLYTDGLVERRDRSLDQGLERLRTAAADSSRDPDELLEEILEACIGDVERADDVAVLVMRFAERVVENLVLRLPAEPSSLVVVRERLRQWLAATPATVEEANDVVLAAWEACANAVEHAQAPEQDTFDVEASIVGTSILVRIQDSGRWKASEARPDRGLGLVLIRSLMDEIDVSPGIAGTVVTMERRVGGEPVGARP